MSASRNAGDQRHAALIVAINPKRSGSLVGFCDVAFPSGLVFRNVAVFERKDGGHTTAPPARPRLDSEGRALRGEGGKVLYEPIIGFVDDGARLRWSATVIAALEERFPEMLGRKPLRQIGGGR